MQLLVSTLIDQLVEHWTINPKVVSSIPVIVKLFDIMAGSCK